MSDFIELIEHETEHTALDFKARQYAKNDHLLKDVLSMANANVSGDRHIVVGVKHYTDGNKGFLGVNEKEFIDTASYQQLVRENIEPELHVEYLPESKRISITRLEKSTPTIRLGSRED